MRIILIAIAVLSLSACVGTTSPDWLPQGSPIAFDGPGTQSPPVASGAYDIGRTIVFAPERFTAQLWQLDLYGRVEERGRLVINSPDFQAQAEYRSRGNVMARIPGLRRHVQVPGWVERARERTPYRVVNCWLYPETARWPSPIYSCS